MSEIMEMEARIKNYVSKEFEKIGRDYSHLSGIVDKESKKQVDDYEKVNKSVDKLSGSNNALANTMKTVVGAIGGMYAIKKVADYSKDAVMNASDLNETITKSEVIFTTSHNTIMNWSKNTVLAFGQTQKQAIDAAASFAVFGKSAGLIGEDLTTFSTDLTELASDLASFFNTTVDEAIVALNSGLRGEALPLRRYGVLLDDVTLKQKALEMGIISSTNNALTPQQRVLAAYQVILSQTTDAQGDFTRTADGMANASRTVSAQFKEISTEVGKSLLPTIERLTIYIRDKLAPKLNELSKAWGWILGGGKESEKEINRLQTITKEIQEYNVLLREQEDIVARLTTLKDQKKWYDPNELEQAKSNIESINESIRKLNEESVTGSKKVVQTKGGTKGGAKGGDLEERKRIAEEIEEIERELTESRIAEMERLKELSIQFDEEQIEAEIRRTKEVLEAYDMLNEAKVASMEDGLKKELAALKIKHDKELSMISDNEKAKNIIIKKYKIERQSIEKKHSDDAAKKDTDATRSRVQNAEMLTDTTLQMVSNIADASKASASAQKIIDISQATANTALGITKAIAKGQYFMAPFIFALGATQIAKIKSQKYAGGGIVPGNNTTGDTVPSLLNSREMVLNQQQQANLFNMIRQPRTLNTISNNENINLNINVGNGNYDMAAARYTVNELVPVIGDVLLRAKNEGRLRNYETAR